MNLRLLKEQNFLTCACVVFLTYGVLFGSTVLLPQLLQTLMGYTATQAGLVLSPAGIVTMLEMPLIGFLLGRKLDPRILVGCGLTIVAFAAHWMAGLTIQGAPMDFVVPRIVQVLGAGMLSSRSTRSRTRTFPGRRSATPRGCSTSSATRGPALESRS